MRYLLAAALFLSAPAPADVPAPSALLDEAIAKVKAMSYRSAKVDWPALEAKVRAEGKDAKDIVDLLPAFETLVDGLGDHHSFVNVSEDDRAAFKARYGHEFFIGRVARKPTSPFIGRRDPSVSPLALTGAKAASLIVVPMHMGGGKKANDYAQVLNDGLARGAAKSCGYVVDLRGNGGGNVWPMLLGLSPLLGEPWNGYDQRPDGSVKAYATVWKGRVTIVDKEDENAGLVFQEIQGWKPLSSLARRPVAVLTDDATGSSGEGVTLAFKGRPATRSFGQTTYGVATSNEGFVLADRVNIVVTTGLMIDRFHRTYLDGVPVDQEVANPASATAAVDPVIDAAKSWLSTQEGCSG